MHRLSRIQEVIVASGETQGNCKCFLDFYTLSK